LNSELNKIAGKQEQKSKKVEEQECRKIDEQESRRARQDRKTSRAKVC